MSESVLSESIDCLLQKHGLANIVQILKKHGCDIISHNYEIKMVCDGSRCPEYIIKNDGIYHYREVCMTGYIPEMCLDCADMPASFLIVCAEMLIGMKRQKMLRADHPDYQKILQIMRNNEDYVLRSVSNTAHYLVKLFVDLTKGCADNHHYFAELKHFTNGSECRCQKCDLLVKFNRGWLKRISSRDMNAFLQKYKGSTFDF